MCYKSTQQRERKHQRQMSINANNYDKCHRNMYVTSHIYKHINAQTKTGKQNMNHLTKSVFVIQNFVFASPNEGYKAVADTFSTDIPSFTCPYDGAESYRRIGRDKIDFPLTLQKCTNTACEKLNAKIWLGFKLGKPNLADDNFHWWLLSRSEV